MRHHRRADDPGGEQDALGAGEAWDHQVLGDFVRRRLGVEQLEREGGDDDADQGGDPRLEPAKAHLLQGEDREGAGAGDHPGGEERNAEQQVEAERGADHLGDVGRHRDQLGLQPEADRGPSREGLPTQLGEVATGRDAQLRRLGLDQHRDQVRRQYDPEQQVAELGAAGDVGGEVAGVDVGDRGDEGRAEEGPDPAEAPAAALQRAPRRGGDRRLAGEDVFDRRAGVGLLPLPRLGRLHGWLHRSPPSSGSRRSGPGIGVPCGSWLGSPSFAAISRSRCSEMWCSSTSASAWTSSSGMPSASER